MCAAGLGAALAEYREVFVPSRDVQPPFHAVEGFKIFAAPLR